ncbi:MAG: CDP-alcohol phosphatidyltransferase family protein [Acutalibacteraceae bacterium]|jgi:CDP-diacylglycerol--serine O-phosphatidyltransferase
MLGFYNYTVWLTFASLATGVLGIGLTCAGHPLGGIICLVICGLCDTFDGRIARTRTKSTVEEKRFGIQLDSLCDLVCFGVLPTTIGYAAGLRAWYFFPVFILYVLAAMIRLAFFNIGAEERVTDQNNRTVGYLGLPVTMVSLILPFVYLLHRLMPAVAFPFVYGGALLVIAAAFVCKWLHVPKPGAKEILIMLSIGLLEFVALLIWGM